MGKFYLLLLRNKKLGEVIAEYWVFLVKISLLGERNLYKTKLMIKLEKIKFTRI